MISDDQLKKCRKCGYRMLEVEIDCLKCELLDDWREIQIKEYIAQHYKRRYPRLARIGVEP